MKKRKLKAVRKGTQRAFYVAAIVLVLVFLINSIATSLFFKRPDRINMVVYGEKTALYSWGKTDNINYFTYMYPDLKILVPGGYGYYRIGALGKLVSLEKKPDLFIKGFSAATSTFVNFYFFPKGSAIYYGHEKEPFVFLPSFNQLWFSASNSTLLDRLYLWSNFFLAKKTDFINLESYPVKSQQQDTLLDEETLGKRYQGFFYHKSYRTEKRTVQIIYTNSYESALTVSRIVEGTGIRVVDISKHDNQPGACIVHEGGEKFSSTAKDLSRFFHCKLKKSKTRVSDIILELGNQESAWVGK